MNICFAYITPFHPNKGGIGRVTHSLTLELLRRGHKVWYLIYDSAITVRHEYDYPAPLTYLPSKELMSADNINAYHQFLREHDIDIVVNQSGNFSDSHLWLDKGDNDKVKVVSVIHTPPIVNYRFLLQELMEVRGDRFIDKLKRIARVCLYPKLKKELLEKRREHYEYLLPRTDAVCTLSEGFFKEIDWLCPGYSEKYFAINNPNSYSTDTVQKFQKKNRQRRIVWVGLFSEQKRPTQTIRLWRRLYKEYPDWELDIIGYNKNNRWAEYLHKEASGLPRINFLGYQNPVEYQSRASIAILTSSYEGWGMVLTEAMQFGTVPVAFNSFESAKDIIDDGVNGFLVEPFSTIKFVEKLRMLMSDEEKRREMSENAVRKVAKFDEATIADKWEDLFQRLVKKHED